MFINLHWADIAHCIVCGQKTFKGDITAGLCSYCYDNELIECKDCEMLYLPNELKEGRCSDCQKAKEDSEDEGVEDDDSSSPAPCLPDSSKQEITSVPDSGKLSLLHSDKQGLQFAEIQHTELRFPANLTAVSGNHTSIQRLHKRIRTEIAGTVPGTKIQNIYL